jgi:phage terminase Nu1 subunit (DNA packaging protein)
MATVSVEKLGAFLNLTRSRIAQLVKDEGMPREARGQYDPVKCAAFYIRYLQAAIERRAAPIEDGGDAGERAARIRLLRVQADKKEMDLAELRSQLVAVSDVDKSLAELVRTTRARLLAVPAQLAPELVGEMQRSLLQAKMEKAFKKALSDLAKSIPENAIGVIIPQAK